MAFDQPASTYSDTTPQRRVITDIISLIDPSDAPLVQALGGLDGGAGKFTFLNWPGTKVEWLEDSLAPLTTTTGSTTHTSAETTINVVDASLIQPGHILLIGSEQMWVSASNLSTNVITVTRAYSGSAASMAGTAAIEIVGMARLEGDDSDPIAFTSRSSNSNFSQIFHQQIQATKTSAVVRQYGIADEFDYQANKAVPSLMRLIEKQLYLGAQKAGSDTTPRAFGGLGTFITNNITDGSSLTKTKIEDALEAIYGDGGLGPWLGVVNPAMAQKIQGFYENTGYLTIDRTESIVGMPPVRTILTPFGNVSLLMDRWCPSTKIYFVDVKNAGLRTLRPFNQEPLAQTGDAVKGEVVGEFTFCMRLDKSHGMMTGCS